MTIDQIKSLTRGNRLTVGTGEYAAHYIVDSNDGKDLVCHMEGQEDPIRWPILGLERVAQLSLAE